MPLSFLSLSPVHPFGHGKHVVSLLREFDPLFPTPMLYPLPTFCFPHPFLEPFCWNMWVSHAFILLGQFLMTNFRKNFFHILINLCTFLWFFRLSDEMLNRGPDSLWQGCQTNFHWGPLQHYGCHQRAGCNCKSVQTLPLLNILLNNCNKYYFSNKILSSNKKYFIISNFFKLQILYMHLHRCKNICYYSVLF